MSVTNCWNVSPIKPSVVDFRQVLAEAEHQHEQEEAELEDFQLALRLHEQLNAGLPVDPTPMDGKAPEMDGVEGGSSDGSDDTGDSQFDTDLALAQALALEEKLLYEEERQQDLDQREGRGKLRVVTEWQATEALQEGLTWLAQEHRDQELENLQEDEEYYLWHFMSQVEAAGRRGGRSKIAGNGLFRRKDTGEIVTKHDYELNGRMNALNLQDGFDEVGDLRGLIIPNTAFNDIRRKLGRNQVKGVKGSKGRMEKSDFVTRDGVIDRNTHQVLLKLQNKEIIGEVSAPVKTGKEAVVFMAENPRAFIQQEEEEKGEVEKQEQEQEEQQVSPSKRRVSAPILAVKILKTTLEQFSNRSEYYNEQKNAHRRQVGKGKRKRFRQWAEKEHRNLIRAHKAGVSVPIPITQQEHVLVMEFKASSLRNTVSSNSQTQSERFSAWAPAPQLSEVPVNSLSAKGWFGLFNKVVEQVALLYQRAHLVHSDLSAYNILLDETSGEVTLIDFAQAVDTTHVSATDYLQRDINNLIAFFSSRCGKYLTTKVSEDEDDKQEEEQEEEQEQGQQQNPYHTLREELLEHITGMAIDQLAAFLEEERVQRQEEARERKHLQAPGQAFREEQAQEQAQEQA